MKLRTEFGFDSAHRLVGYDGKCNMLHGHYWKVEVIIEGQDFEIDKIGILWDFTNVKKIKDYFDHKTILKKCPENESLLNCLITTCGANSFYLMSDNPTAENLCKEIMYLLQRENNKLKYKVKVWESEKSYAELE